MILPDISSLKKLLAAKGSSLVRTSSLPRWGLFTDPVKTIQTKKFSEVSDCFREIEKNTKRGQYCSLVLSYESAPAFDHALQVKKTNEVPLLWAAFYRKPTMLLKYEDFPHSIPSRISNKKEISWKDYKKAIDAIKKFINDGDTYQVNFTFKISSIQVDDPVSIFLNLFKSQRPEYGAFVNTGDTVIASISPELFIRKLSSKIFSIPMKGTSARMPDYEEDLIAAKSLSLDPKNRAENLMITDMVRNDLGKICTTGSIRVKNLFKIVSTASLHQMVSEIEGKILPGKSLFEIFRALFPAASITGAPKVRAMEIIKELEKTPRGIYTGTIGLVSPNGDFIFNVAIRTAVFTNGKVSAGIGGGIVADSNAKDEWKEADLKSSFLNSRETFFEIFETILFEEKSGFLYLDEHLDRMEKSQKYFLRQFNREKIKNALLRISQKLPPIAKVKISVTENGKHKIEYSRLKSNGWGKKNATAIISQIKTNSSDIMLHHKTTIRKIYDEEFQKIKTLGFDEVIFMNERGEITEGAISNVFAKIKNKWITPPLKCGLLPGIWRNKMMLQLKATEQIITAQDLLSAEKVIIGNSVRGSINVFLKKNKKNFSFFS